MTPVDIVHQRRVAAVTYAVKCGNVSETSRVFGVSRKTIHQWKKLADAYGMEALRPKAQRPPQMPNATPTWVIDKLLRLVMLEPTRGARHFAGVLGGDGFEMSKSGVQNLLNRHGLGTRSQRVAVAAPAGTVHGRVGDRRRPRFARRPQGGTVRVLPMGSRSRRPGRSRLLLHRETQRRRRGVATHRSRYQQQGR